MTTDPFRDLSERRAKAEALGGPEQVKRQQERGKLTARQRLARLCDPGSFQELDRLVRHRATAFGLDKTEIPGDGVVTGHGLVAGRPVCAFAQDFTSLGGTLGEAHAQKIHKVMDLALKLGCPLVGLHDSGGARIQEGVDALAGYGGIFARNSALSGVVPQIAAMMGPTAGGAVYSPAMMDWVFMVKDTSYMFITGPDVIRQVTGEEITPEELGGAMTHNARSGVAHFLCQDDAAAIAQIRELLSYLPANNLEEPPVLEPQDDPRRADAFLDTVIPADPRKGYDMREVIRSLVDGGQTLEPHALWAQNIIICFARLNGRSIGVIASQPASLTGALDVDASDKASRFIRFCDAFNLPLLTLVDTPGYLPGSAQEWAGIIRHGAKLLWSYAEATVPKLTVITRKAYGGAYIAMCSRHLGADLSLAWPTAEIAVMGAEGATAIIHRREIAASADPAAKLQEKIKEYQEQLYNPYVAAARGYVDDVVLPHETRPRLIAALEALASKRESRPPKKHGNIPL